MSIKNLPADYLLAAQQGDIDKVKTCLALGVDINTCDRQGKTAITLASLYQQYALRIFMKGDHSITSIEIG